MVRQLNLSPARGWKAALATLVALGAVAWHIMACVESPMSFSPRGDLAFTVAEPYYTDANDNVFSLADVHVYRVMILTSERELREIERSSTLMLSGPAYSPDGERIAYLRRPLVTHDKMKRLGEFATERRELYEQATAGEGPEKWMLFAPEDSVPGLSLEGLDNALGGWSDMTLPSLEQFKGLDPHLEVGGAIAPTELVIRQASTGEILHSIQILLPGSAFLMSYVFTRIQFSPDGQWLYFWLDSFAIAVNPETSERHIWAVDALPVLSPDGKTLAALHGETLGFLQTDGGRASYVRLKEEVAVSGMAWIDEERLVVLAQEEPHADVYDIDGLPVGSVKLPALVNAKEQERAQLAVSPDGSYMVVSLGETIHFFSTDGQLLRTLEPGGETFLYHPTFTRESRQIAFKVMVEPTEEDYPHDDDPLVTTDVAFFTPEGQELFRVPIPRIPPEDRPAPPAPAEGPLAEPAPATEETQQ